MNIQDSTVLVTGPTAGSARRFAEALLDRGATKVYAAVRNVSTITDPRLVPIQLDVTAPNESRRSRASSTTYRWLSTTPESSTSASR